MSILIQIYDIHIVYVSSYPDKRKKRICEYENIFKPERITTAVWTTDKSETYSTENLISKNTQNTNQSPLTEDTVFDTSTTIQVPGGGTPSIVMNSTYSTISRINDESNDKILSN